MDDIEHLVRVTLTDRAAGLGGPADLAAAARGRAQHLRRRAQAAGAAVAAVAVLLAVPAAIRLWPHTSIATVDAGAPVAVEAAVPPFPYRPTVTPPGYGSPIAELSAGVPSLRFEGGAQRWLTVAASTERPAPAPWEGEPKSFGETVHGRKAVLELVPNGYALTWEEADGRWLRVEADRVVPRAELMRFAEGLRPGEVPVRWPFTFEAVPPRMVPDVVSPAAVAFRPQAAAPSHGFTGKLAVLLSDTADGTPAGGRQVAVGGRTGWFSTESGSAILSVDLGDGRALVVQSDAALGLGEAELVAFAAGVRPTPDAAVGHG